MQECKEKDYTYSAPLYVNAEFENGDTGEIKSQTVFTGDFPLQTPHGTFIIGGTERVIVTLRQPVRSPGVYFDRQQDRTSDKEVFGAKDDPEPWCMARVRDSTRRTSRRCAWTASASSPPSCSLMAIGMTKSENRPGIQGLPAGARCTREGNPRDPGRGTR